MELLIARLRLISLCMSLPLILNGCVSLQPLPTVDETIRASLAPAVRTNAVDEVTYDLYLKGLGRLQRYGFDPSFAEAIGFFEQAAARDHEFANAWVGLARSYWIDDITATHPKEKARLAKRALQRALDIDPDHPRALSLLGFIRAHVDYQWAEGTALMERAASLRPQDAFIQMTHAEHLVLTQQTGAMDATEKAYRLDPLSYETNVLYTKQLQAEGRQIDAERAMASYLESTPEPPDIWAAATYIVAGKLELAGQHIENAKSVWGANHTWVRILESMLALANGDTATVSAIEQELLQRMETEYVDYSLWGTPDSLPRRLALAYQQEQPHLVQSVLHRGLPPPPVSVEQYQELRERMNIAQLGDTAAPMPRSRTRAEVRALLAKGIELDPSVLDTYVGVYEAVDVSYTLEFHRSGRALWFHDLENGWNSRMIAVADNAFEMLNPKGQHFRFLAPGAEEYDMENTYGQLVYHYRRLDDVPCVPTGNACRSALLADRQLFRNERMYSQDDMRLLATLSELGEGGDAEALYHVGMMYHLGIGTETDLERALKWFGRSAAAHDPLGAYKLGCYFAGQGGDVVEVDHDKALTNKLVAAEAGYALAQQDVAGIYTQQGEWKVALKWLDEAADQGSLSSLYALASVYAKGTNGIPKDLPIAYAYFVKWDRMASRQMRKEARAALGTYFDELERQDKRNARAAAKSWKPRPTALTIKAGSGLRAAKELAERSGQ